MSMELPSGSACFKQEDCFLQVRKQCMTQKLYPRKVYKQRLPSFYVCNRYLSILLQL
jgi:hypothetical protein